jgi:flavin-dependent dehydrogenase
VGLEPSAYILKKHDHVTVDEVRIKADLMTCDKPSLISDLLQDATVNYTDGSQPDLTSYDRVIDATGVSRAFLPPIREDFVLPCVQFRVQTDEVLGNRIKLGGIGYAWCFPLGEDEYHIGCGSLISDPRTLLQNLGWMKKTTSARRTICACSGHIRLAGPHSSQPFVANNNNHEVWGVGESIGCVAPLAGDGIIPGMRSAQILLDHWEDPSGYAKAILKQFEWMLGERKVVEKLQRNEPLRLSDAWVLKKNSRRMAINVGLKDAAMLLKRLR